MLAYGLERLARWDPPCIHATKGHDAVVNVAPQDLQQLCRVASILYVFRVCPIGGVLVRVHVCAHV